MKVLVLNSGSSSLKFQLFDMENEAVIVKGDVEKIGLDGSHIVYSPMDGEKIIRQRNVANHAEAIDLVMSMLMDKKFGAIKAVADIDAIGHRAIHGGTKLIEPVLITADVIRELESVSYMAPLHNPPSIL
ncbi:MAG: acetate kinase, partial [Firmicutes bacterium]|nr:acetate kinase [Bacillota bacterium]